jgi:hypothetical protein
MSIAGLLLVLSAARRKPINPPLKPRLADRAVAHGERAARTGGQRPGLKQLAEQDAALNVPALTRCGRVRRATPVVVRPS